MRRSSIAFFFGFQVGLSPWANYTFHVRAKNSLGMSDRSDFTQVKCKTQASIPLKNPDHVCTESRDPTQLVITWDVSTSGVSMATRREVFIGDLKNCQNSLCGMCTKERQEEWRKGSPTLQNFKSSCEIIQ